ncbi:MAG: polyhydroxyalkanoate synthesis regulator DNA-binding domain-containing protein [Leptospiraceae bacterium]|nr:polyhydroxyalkanoate synthesis regulator DNA-binding domain-containing protein [Leptospiraceae bacterium]MDW7975995.1 polyhydroxyalkanoate synthesis regulator DNA-binding domain-containing protein [Leptospiraceae bacterium]
MLIIKKYSNRRLYDVQTSKIITLDKIVEYILHGEEIVVIDNKTGKDITSKVLAQTFMKLASKNKNDDFTKFLFYSLIRELKSNLANFLSRLIQGGIGTEFLNTERLTKIVEEFIGKGELTIHEKESYLRQIHEKLQNQNQLLDELIRKEILKNPEYIEKLFQYLDKRESK